MSLKKEILESVKKHIKDNFESSDVENIPTINQQGLTFDNKGLLFKTTVLYIDLRSSTFLLKKHQKKVVAKIHKAYYSAIVKVARNSGGDIRSFNGDSLLVFFEGNNKESANKAVKCAMKMTFILSEEEGINKHLKQYTSIDFGIGVDSGEVLCTKVGIKGENENKDLIWIGDPVNRSTILSNEGKNPYNIHISPTVYCDISHELTYNQLQNMWTRSGILYNNSYESCYKTSYHWIVL